jgi:hypothetical protein
LPRAKPQARPVGLSDARSYLDKAQELLRAAQHALELSNYTAAVGNAVHAGIAAGDALSAARAGTVWRSEHAQAAGHLRGRSSSLARTRANPHGTRLIR